MNNFFFFFSFCSLCAVLSESDARHNDWLIQNVGSPLFLYPNFPNFFSVSDRTVSCLSVNGGKLIWRRVVPDNERIRIAHAGSNTIVTSTEIDNGESKVYAWSYNGAVRWQATFESVRDIKMMTIDKEVMVMVLFHNGYETRNSYDGQITSSWKDDDYEMINANGIIVGKSKNNIVLVRGAGDVIDFGVDKKDIHSILSHSDYFLILHNETLKKCEKTCKEVLTNVKTLKKITKELALASGDQKSALIVDGTPDIILLEGNPSVFPLFNTKSKEPSHDSALMAIVDDRIMTLQLIDLKTGNLTPRGSLLLDEPRGAAQIGFSYVNEAKWGMVNSFLDESLSASIILLDNVEFDWIREESVAKTEKALLYQIPADIQRPMVQHVLHKTEYHPDHASSVAASHDLHNQLKRYKSLFQLIITFDVGAVYEMFTTIVSIVMEKIASIGQHFQDELISTKKAVKLSPGGPFFDVKEKDSSKRLDQALRKSFSGHHASNFGADTLAFLATASCKVVAMHSFTGMVIWHRNLAALVNWDVTAKITSFQTTSSLKADLLVAVLTKNQQIIVWLDGLTGETLHLYETVPLARVLHFPTWQTSDFETSSETVDPVLIVTPMDEDEWSVSLTPGDISDNSETIEKLKKTINNLHFHTIDEEKMTLLGYRINFKDINRCSIGVKECLSTIGASKTWMIALQSKVKILASSHVLHSQFGHAPALVKGDTSIKFKHIDKNLMALVIQDVDTDNKLKLILVNTVTGDIKYQLWLHEGSTKGQDQTNVLVALCDNFVVVHYWNPWNAYWQVTVVELFKDRVDPGPWKIISSFGKENRESAFNSEPLEIVERTYSFNSAAKAIGVSASRDGITTRGILFALSNNNILMLTKTQVSARRPVIPPRTPPKGDDKELIEEGIPPYNSTLAIKAEDMLAYNQLVFGIKDIVSSPTNLESTSLVLAYGLDLFFTPLQPAKGFDVLSQSFNYPLLVMSIVALAAGLLWSSYATKRNKLAFNWK
eukprot:GHVL01021727.1.p1 GENE.GHVL01021727.1~~GHVL01021727.1.p1  ORF type:complete len:1000 (+),score=160.76 GHVL01021727.1:36-3035(+)